MRMVSVIFHLGRLASVNNQWSGEMCKKLLLVVIEGGLITVSWAEIEN